MKTNEQTLTDECIRDTWNSVSCQHKQELVPEMFARAIESAVLAKLGAVAEPLQVFSKGPWTFRETGQDFTGAQLDEAAFVAYRARLPAASEGASLGAFLDAAKEAGITHLPSDFAQKLKVAASEAGAVALPTWWDAFIQNICEVPDRNSPMDDPQAMIANRDELEACALRAIEDAAPSDAPVEVGAVQYVPIAVNQHDEVHGRHPNDKEPRSPAMRKALDDRGDDRGQGLDTYWKWGFATGWNAALAAPSDAPAQQEPEWIDDPHDIEQGMMHNPKYVAPAAQGDEATIRKSRTVQLSGNSGELSAQGGERAAFEAHMNSTGMYWDDSREIDYDGDEQYADVETRLNFGVWQAAIDAALSRQPSAGDADAKDAAAYRRINTPEISDFLTAVHNEALHQRERWGAQGDAGKTDADWFWLVGYLAGKAIRPGAGIEKQLHHIITTAAACLNWHGARVGAYIDMRPGIADPDAARAQRAAEQESQ
jgi:hypothetical protein